MEQETDGAKCVEVLVTAKKTGQIYSRSLSEGRSLIGKS